MFMFTILQVRSIAKRLLWLCARKPQGANPLLQT